MNKLFIPKTIKVGFQNRKGTYTGKLAYVIYYDNKGKLRKEKSWHSWRDQTIEPIEIPNEPTSGFVLNKKVGGYKSDWNFRQAYSRVYDPRDFEFEIDIPNLLFILGECDCYKGKGLEGEFVYAWNGTELVLLPTCCEAYKKCSEYSTLQGKKVAAKELIPEATYLTKNQEEVVYLGRLPFYYVIDKTRTRDNSWYDQLYNKDKYKSGERKRHVFWDGERFVFDIQSQLAEVASETTNGYAELVESYTLSKYGSKVVRLFSSFDEKLSHRNGYHYGHHDPWYVKMGDSWIAHYVHRDYGYHSYWDYKKDDKINKTTRAIGQVTLDSKVIVEPYSTVIEKENTGLRLFAELESGKSYDFNILPRNGRE